LGFQADLFFEIRNRRKDGIQRAAASSQDFGANIAHARFGICSSGSIRLHFANAFAIRIIKMARPMGLARRVIIAIALLDIYDI
jgi:hypothetical protein